VQMKPGCPRVACVCVSSSVACVVHGHGGGATAADAHAHAGMLSPLLLLLPVLPAGARPHGRRWRCFKRRTRAGAGRAEHCSSQACVRTSRWRLRPWGERRCAAASPAWPRSGGCARGLRARPPGEGGGWARTCIVGYCNCGCTCAHICLRARACVRACVRVCHVDGRRCFMQALLRCGSCCLHAAMPMRTRASVCVCHYPDSVVVAAAPCRRPSACTRAGLTYTTTSANPASMQRAFSQPQG
jgi:hypothetical protein